METLKNTPYWTIWADGCRLHKKFFGIKESDDAAWDQLMKEAECIINKYKNLPESEFAEKMVLQVVSEVDKKAKGESEDAKKE